MITCPHDVTVPVETIATLLAEPETVARLCAACLERLPASWGCPDCEWFEVHLHGETQPRRRLGRPCSKHWKDVV